jgi:hypothetical protein
MRRGKTERRKRKNRLNHRGHREHREELEKKRCDRWPSPPAPLPTCVAPCGRQGEGRQMQRGRGPLWTGRMEIGTGTGAPMAGRCGEMCCEETTATDRTRRGQRMEWTCCGTTIAASSWRGRTADRLPAAKRVYDAQVQPATDEGHCSVLPERGDGLLPPTVSVARNSRKRRTFVRTSVRTYSAKRSDRTHEGAAPKLPRGATDDRSTNRSIPGLGACMLEQRQPASGPRTHEGSPH